MMISVNFSLILAVNYALIPQIVWVVYVFSAHVKSDYLNLLVSYELGLKQFTR